MADVLPRCCPATGFGCTQNRESCALHLKIDELLWAVRGAQNTFINLEDLSEEDLYDLKEKSAALAECARLKVAQPQAPPRTGISNRTSSRLDSKHVKQQS
jgi:low affinity Fe/Cu permease